MLDFVERMIYSHEIPRKELCEMDSPSTHDTTIVVPVYNVEKYLPECIDSIIHQTYPNIDIILVDDGSTDSSGQICDTYAKLDPRISVIHKPNGGLSDARNAGLTQAHTKYIYFLDSDDYIEPQAIEILRGVCEQNNLDMVGFDVNEIVVEDGCTYVESYEGWRSYGTYPDVMTGANLYVSLRKNNDYRPPVQVHFYNREFLVRNNLAFKKGIVHEDELFTFTAMLYAQRVMHINARLYDRRIRSDSIMTRPRTQRNSDCMHEIIREILDKYSRFRGDPDTKEAYDLSIKNLARSYALNYALAFDVQNEKGHSQFIAMMNDLQALGYDVSWCKRRVKLRGLYNIKSAIGKIPGLKRIFRALRYFLKRSIKRISSFGR